MQLINASQSLPGTVLDSSGGQQQKRCTVATSLVQCQGGTDWIRFDTVVVDTAKIAIVP